MRTEFPTRAPLVIAPLWLLMAVSAFVSIEPAPFDLLAAGLCVFFFGIGLKVSRDLQLPLLLLSTFLLTNAVSIVFAPFNTAQPVFEMLVFAALTVYLIVVWLVLTSVIATDAVFFSRLLWNGWLVAAVAAVTLGLAGYFQLVPDYEAFLMQGRVKSTFKDPNVYAPYLVPVALYLLTRIRGRPPLSQAVYLLLFLYVVIGLLLGFSRGAWGNFLVSFLVFSGLALVNARTLGDYARLLWAGSAVIVLTVVVTITAISIPEVRGMFETRAALVQSYDVQVGGRFSIQKAALEEIAKNPVGLGPDRSASTFGLSPHNVYLKVAAENGWVGGVVFIAFLGVTLWQGFVFALQRGPLQTEFAVAYASTIGVISQSVIIDTLHWRHFFVLLAMVWGIMIAKPRHVATTAVSAHPGDGIHSSTQTAYRSGTTRGISIAGSRRSWIS